MGIFKEDGLTAREVEELVDTFPGQSIDFFGALRARIYDDAVKVFAMDIGYENIGKNLIKARGGQVGLFYPFVLLLLHVIMEAPGGHFMYASLMSST